jgi:hypothetical protein
MMWQGTTAVVVSLTLLALVTGCSSRSGSTAASSAPTGSVAASPTMSNLTGAWQGNVGVGARSTTLRMNLKQDGPAVKGDIAVGGRADLSGSVTGTVQGDTVRLRLESGASAPQLRVQGDTITGVISGEPLTAQRVR